MEGAAVQRFIEGNRPTDPGSDAFDHTSKKCDSANGLDCGYNSFWKDSGTAFARVVLTAVHMPTSGPSA